MRVALLIILLATLCGCASRYDTRAESSDIRIGEIGRVLKATAFPLPQRELFSRIGGHQAWTWTMIHGDRAIYSRPDLLVAGTGYYGIEVTHIENSDGSAQVTRARLIFHSAGITFYEGEFVPKTG
jgi:hypothetical protein